MSQLPSVARTDAVTSMSWSCEVLSDTRDNITRKLRLSLVDSCNLNCFFCHNEGQGIVKQKSTPTLSVSDIRLIVSAAVSAGIREVKLTGGEPLLYRDNERTIVDLVNEINDLRTDEHFGLSITTNGLLLPKFAKPLAESGLDRATVSLHTLNDSSFAQLVSVKGSRLRADKVVAGVRAAVESGLTPVKVNTVLFQSAENSVGNLDEIADIVNVCRETGVSQLRLYTLLRHPGFENHSKWYRHWSDELLRAVGTIVIGDDAAAEEFAQTAKSFLDSSRAVVYPRPHLILRAGNFELMIEALESGQFDKLGLPDEGPYALRVSADGRVRGLISQQPSTADLVQLIAEGRTEGELRAIFMEAREHALPSEQSKRI
jgi:molybdenum cofactor biosynthesis enzyme MoaA